MNHWIEVRPAKKGERHAFTPAELVQQDFIAKKSELFCIACHQMVPVPDGDIEKYLDRRMLELSISTTYVKLVIVCKQGVGKLPPGYTKASGG